MNETFRTMIERRTFLGSAAAGIGLLASSGSAQGQSGPIALGPGSKILFQGDSITDAGRNREDPEPNRRSGLGGGYPFLLAASLLADHPGLNLQIFNRGISGNKVPDLNDRWQQEAIDLKPDVVSILVGVNDLWHKLNGRYDGSVEDYESGYRALIQRTLSEIPGARIVVCEPFVLRCGAVTDDWFPEFEQRRQAARKLAIEFSLRLVAFQSMFDEALSAAPPEYWAADGVHPTLAGHALMAREWRQGTGI